MEKAGDMGVVEEDTVATSSKAAEQAAEEVVAGSTEGQGLVVATASSSKASGLHLGGNRTAEAALTHQQAPDLLSPPSSPRQHQAALHGATSSSQHSRSTAAATWAPLLQLHGRAQRTPPGHAPHHPWC